VSDAEKAPPHAERHARGARPKFYTEPGLDQAMSMILVLASELSVLRDRIDAIERVGTRHGIDFAKEIDGLTLDQAALDAREERRQSLLQRLYYLVRKEARELTDSDDSEKYRQVIETLAQK
jgi:hypothetical protein